MSIGRASHHTSSSRGALFVGLTVGAAGLTTGCGAPETGSLENLQRGPKAGPVDYTKLDYAKLDYARIDYAKIDPNKVDLSKLSNEAVAKLLASRLDKIEARTLHKSLVRKLKANREGAVASRDKELITKIDSLLEALKAADSVFSTGPTRW